MMVRDVAAGTDVEHAIHLADRQFDVRNVAVASHAAVTADAADYVTISLKQGSNTVASLTTATTGLAAKTFRALTLTAANARIEDGETLTLDVAHTGSTGVAVTGLVVNVEFAPTNQ
tara:strand:- start:2983 stop:3333 length:351 start_codon:yes stop_codon:yes gene_type:complete